MIRHILSIGLIPENSGADYITAGDAEAFGGVEATVVLDDESGELHCLENNCAFPIGDLWSSIATFTRIEAEILTPVLGDAHGLNDTTLATAWAYFMDEIEVIPDNLIQVADEDSGGEFSNPDGGYDGKAYLRYQLDEEGEYYGERIIVFL